MVRCRACGEENPRRFRLCGFCGTALEAQALVEVRKKVTVLFSDVAGSTSLGELLDPESLREVMGRYFDVMRAAIERHGGDRAAAAAAADDIESQVLVRSVQSLLHLHAGRVDEAAATIAAALELLCGAEAPTIVADAAVVSARVASARGDRTSTDRELTRATALYRQKGNLVSKARVAELRASLAERGSRA
jgi:class 3 adenylate cyclase